MKKFPLIGEYADYRMEEFEEVVVFHLDNMKKTWLQMADALIKEIDNVATNEKLVSTAIEYEIFSMIKKESKSGNYCLRIVVPQDIAMLWYNELKKIKF